MKPQAQVATDVSIATFWLKPYPDVRLIPQLLLRSETRRMARGCDI